MKKQLLIVDGYNVIGSWPELIKLKMANRLSDARDRLLDILSEYKKYRDIQMIVVFDAMYVSGLSKHAKHYNLDLVWTNKDETADSYIEALARRKQSRFTQVVVVTSDNAEQWTVFSAGALRMSDRELLEDVQRSKREIKHHIKSYEGIRYIRKSPFDNQQLDKLASLRDHLSTTETKHQQATPGIQAKPSRSRYHSHKPRGKQPRYHFQSGHNRDTSSSLDHQQLKKLLQLKNQLNDRHDHKY